MRTTWTGWCALLIIGLMGQTAIAKNVSHPTAPGKYTDWNDEIDELEVVAAFKLADYKTISVAPLDVSATPLPDQKDNTYVPVKAVLENVATSFTNGIREEIKSPDTTVSSAGDSSATLEANAMLVKCVVDTMDPGSRAARYWGGFGAGAARTKLTCDVNDASTGSTLLRFTQERRSGIGMFGGDYEKLMHRNLEQIGNDLAAALNYFK